MRGVILAGLLWGASAAAAPAPPPSLDGLWTNTTATPFERPREFHGPTISDAQAAAFRAQQARPVERDALGQRESEWYDPAAPMLRVDGKLRASIIIEPENGRLPYTPAARRLVNRYEQAIESAFDGPEARPASERCLTGASGSSGVPILPIRYNTNYLIVQTPDHVAIWSETGGTARIIRLNASSPLPRNMRPWMGDSIGHWEGRSLVVETTNFNPEEVFKASRPLVISKDAKVTERFTRISADQILYDFTVDDPATFTRPWRGQTLFRATKGPIFEYACHEGNYSMLLELSGARRAEQAAR